MHWDVMILAPFASLNFLVGLVDWDALNWLCIGMGIVGAGLLWHQGTYRSVMTRMKLARSRVCE